MNWTKFIQLMEELIEVKVQDMKSDDIEDKVLLMNVRDNIINELHRLEKEK